MQFLVRATLAHTSERMESKAFCNSALKVIRDITAHQAEGAEVQSGLQRQVRLWRRSTVFFARALWDAKERIRLSRGRGSLHVETVFRRTKSLYETKRNNGHVARMSEKMRRYRPVQRFHVAQGEQSLCKTVRTLLNLQGKEARLNCFWSKGMSKGLIWLPWQKICFHCYI